MDSPVPTIQCAQHRSQQDTSSWGEASKELSPTAAQQGHQASLLPPHRSFITAISGRKHKGLHELQHGLDLSKSAGLEIELWT